MNRIDSILSFELLKLSGIPVTVASLLTCILIFLVSLVAARMVRRAIERAIRGRGRSNGVAAAVGKIVWYSLVFTGAFVALDTLGFNLTALLAGSAVLLVGIGFGLQNIAQNFISGIIVLIERPVKEGDYIRVGDESGWVRDVGLRGTKVVTRDEIAIIVPNSELVSSQVVNHSSVSGRIRVAVSVGVEYGSDIELVRDTLMAIGDGHPKVLSDPGPEVFFANFGSSSLDFELRYWISDPADDRRICSAIRVQIDAAFRERHIVIAFPQQDLHIRSGLEALAPVGSAGS